MGKAKPKPLIPMDHPITIAVLPLKQRACDRAESYALEDIGRVSAALEANGFDKQACAPYPHGNQPAVQYQAALAKYKLFSAVTETAPGQRHSIRGPHIVVMSQDGCAKYTYDARANAAFQYDAFILKLLSKIESCKAATLEGCHVWGHSILTVTKADGTIENWKTQMIINRSVNGLLFNQFPTRKVKGA